jgi:hypothetical protein
VLCRVWDNDFDEEILAVVTGFEYGWYYVEAHGCNYRYAEPVTQEDIDKLIWKGGSL